MLHRAFKLYNALLEIYTDQINKIKIWWKKKVKKSKPKYVSIKTKKYKGWISENGDENEDKKSLMYQPYHH